jgi:hypothetical protein
LAEFVDLQGEPAIVVAPEVQEPLLTAYYSELVKSPITARETAQRAFAVVTAISAALVAAGALVKLPERSDWVVAFGLITLVGWLIASLLFMQAMGSRAFQKSPSATSKDDWARLAINEIVKSRNTLYRWLVAARVATLVSTILTVIVLIAAIQEVRDARTEHVTIRLTTRGARQLAPVCPRATGGIEGNVNPGALKDRFITLAADSGQCGATTTNVRIRSAKVISVAP